MKEKLRRATYAVERICQDMKKVNGVAFVLAGYLENCNDYSEYTAGAAQALFDISDELSRELENANGEMFDVLNGVD